MPNFIILFIMTSLCKIVLFVTNNVRKYDRTRHATDENVTECKSVECLMSKATHTHSKYIIICLISD
jgi:hypothetical protein